MSNPAKPRSSTPPNPELTNAHPFGDVCVNREFTDAKHPPLYVVDTVPNDVPSAL